MRQERLMKVLLAPHVSEKTTIIEANSRPQYAFKVATDANKLEIKAAVELLFKVVVDSVSITTVKGKTKRFGQRQGKRNGWKKAYVALAEGHKIDLGTGEA